MYPVDTVKTRIQASPHPVTAAETFRAILRERGPAGLMRGSLVIGAGCIPAHIGLFSTYEFAKASLLDLEGEDHQPLRAAACGAMATVAHDMVLTPSDVVKQRLQLGGYKGTLDCVTSVYRSEGAMAFYRSLPATLAMNAPYMGVLVAANESMKRLLDLNGFRGKDRSTFFAGAPWYFFSAGVSGAVAATVTCPLDVTKTRLQTQGCVQPSLEGAVSKPRYTGILSTMRVISETEGMRGFFRGLGPRVALAAPSAAICWGTYETIRMALSAFSTSSLSSASPSSSSAEAKELVTKDSFEWEEWDGSTPFWQHAVAGSCAGVMEHVAMYPVDTVKTRMQALPSSPGASSPGALQVLRTVVQEQGAAGLMRGCFAIGIGCIPAHVGLFCTYEVAKARLMDMENVEHQPIHAAACGAMATVVHDMIITPTDVVKQRLQLGCHRNTFDCIKSVWRQEGLIAFYRSLPTTLLSECPFHGVLVATNESLKVLLNLESRGCSDRDQGPKAAIGWHFFSTGISGMFAAVITQPLDVVKTRLQTQGIAAQMDAESAENSARQVRYRGMLSAARLIHQEEGMRGLFRGTVPRLLFAAPSAALCWGTYEVVKTLLRQSSGG